eukprot:scaffold292867_cov28-Prasinocladus_malaysianus.AAC.2
MALSWNLRRTPIRTEEAKKLGKARIECRKSNRTSEVSCLCSAGMYDAACSLKHTGRQCLNGRAHLGDHLVIILSGLVEFAPRGVHVSQHTVCISQLGAVAAGQHHRLAQLAHPQQVALGLLVVAHLVGGSPQAPPGLPLGLPGGVQLAARRADLHQRPLKGRLGLLALLLLEQSFALLEQPHHRLLGLVGLVGAARVDVPVHLFAHLLVGLEQLGVELLHLLGPLAGGPASHKSADEGHPLYKTQAISQAWMIAHTQHIVEFMETFLL